MYPRSICPVLDLQAWHLAEILPVARHQGRTVGQGEGRDQKVAPSDLLPFLVMSQSVELSGGRRANGEDGEPVQILLVLVQPLLGLEQLFAVLRLEHGGEPPLEDLDPADQRNGHFLRGLCNSLRHPSMSPEQEGEYVSQYRGRTSRLLRSINR
jgi:hypothetical protein